MTCAPGILMGIAHAGRGYVTPLLHLGSKVTLGRSGTL